ncbi:MAG: endonuclease III [Gemmatimonadetes bacterium]|uniref:Endonuclease III n=1 Tax=Candidatus Kutchimonas denitrificans TaxID=3056748 RepID=A0AAE4Z9J2_9BACT|nr:endonuclease III [Gemmatimonadota bacterium]NIR76299.1 endonuclease III [Candidatus Kutchimonas denitrificans]NIS02322.1 endonuclease III [Gemmatimonadota bacterium]NIT68141.1 endonuclease III [Gemmatimonadota bacterium]NIU54365.1 endonuclease III [Gemmatimonadota bacterium]
MSARKKTGNGGSSGGKRSGQAAADRAAAIVQRLAEAYPAQIELEFSNPLELAVATILSAQCTDARVNEVTRDLFKKYQSAEDYADADPEEFQEEIRSTGFFRNKTKSILGFARALVERHDGEVPKTLEELVELPGIGRKTANVILGSGFGIDEGIVVDTHVKRVSQRLELTEASEPEKIERDLMEVVPQERWNSFGLRMVLHGRYTCHARKPKCDGCPLEELCPSAHTV